jgi:hypothetical protein
MEVSDETFLAAMNFSAILYPKLEIEIKKLLTQKFSEVSQ